MDVTGTVERATTEEDVVHAHLWKRLGHSITIFLWQHRRKHAPAVDESDVFYIVHLERHCVLSERWERIQVDKVSVRKRECEESTNVRV